MNVQEALEYLRGVCTSEVMDVMDAAPSLLDIALDAHAHLAIIGTSDGKVACRYVLGGQSGYYLFPYGICEEGGRFEDGKVLLTQKDAIALGILLG